MSTVWAGEPPADLLGMRLDRVTLAAAVARIFAALEAGEGGTVLTPNVEILRRYRSSPELRRAFADVDLLVTDGMPLVVALRIAGTPVPERITGTDLLWAVTREAAARGRRVLLVGGRPGEAQRAATRLTELDPALEVRSHPCYVTPDTEAGELAALLEVAAAARPDVVFLGLPFRTQVAAMALLRDRVPGAWHIGVGSSFDFVNGDRRRAPRWVQRCCLEWAWRLIAQPWMWRRYLVDGLPCAARLGLHAVGVRWSTRGRASRPSPR